MEALTEEQQKKIFKLKLRSTMLICDWLRDYPHKRYPKQKFERRYASLLEIDEKLNKIIRTFDPELV